MNYSEPIRIFESIPAARDNRIYLVDASAFFARPGPRIVDSLEVLAGILHPERFPEFAGNSFVQRCSAAAPIRIRDGTGALP